jgi:hypothetical protein
MTIYRVGILAEVEAGAGSDWCVAQKINISDRRMVILLRFSGCCERADKTTFSQVIANKHYL